MSLNMSHENLDIKSIVENYHELLHVIIEKDINFVKRSQEKAKFNKESVKSPTNFVGVRGGGGEFQQKL